MRILIITPHFPNPISGGGIALLNMIRGLSRDHEVFLISRAYPEDLSHVSAIEGCCRRVEVFMKSDRLVDKLYNKIRYWHKSPRNLYYHFEPGIPQKANELIDKYAIDIVQLEFTSSGQYLPHIKHQAKILRQHDVTFITEAARLAATKGVLAWLRQYIRYRALLAFELEACCKADLVVVPSEEDCRALLAHIPRLKVSTIPHGIDSGRFDLQRQPCKEPSLIFIGDFRRRANSDAVLYFTREVFSHILRRQPAARLYLVGASPPPAIKSLASSNIIVTGFVEDIRPFLTSSCVFVAPLTWGGGIKVKILEAMAAGTPAVTTSIGAYGIGLTPGEHAFVEDDPQAFATRVLELMDNPVLNRRMGEAGRAFVAARFDWRAIIASLEQNYEALLRAGRAAGGGIFRLF